MMLQIVRGNKHMPLYFLRKIWEFKEGDISDLFRRTDMKITKIGIVDPFGIKRELRVDIPFEFTSEEIGIIKHDFEYLYRVNPDNYDPLVSIEDTVICYIDLYQNMIFGTSLKGNIDTLNIEFGNGYEKKQ